MQPTNSRARSSDWRRRPSLAAIVVACVAAVALGFASTRLNPTWVAVGAITLLPVVSHIRWVGLKRAIAEPSVITIVLFFYLSVFPQRGLVIALNHFRDVAFGYTVTSLDLVGTLVLAGLGTTAFVETFHRVVGYPRRAPQRRPVANQVDSHSMGLLAILLGAVALIALAIIVAQTGGLATTTSVFLPHSKAASAEAGSFAGSAWAIAAVPAVWCAAYTVADRTNPRTIRLAFLTVAVVLVASQLLIFGSRLNALLALVGAWVVLHHSGRSIPPVAVLASIPILVLVSIPIVSQRPGVNLADLPAKERYSRVASYGVLDVALAVRQHSEDIKHKLTNPHRWLDLPLYLVPSPLWPTKPSIDDKRLDVYVAQAIGNKNQQDTGLPSSYLTELRLYAGWLGVLLGGMVLGAVSGALHRILIGSSGVRAPPASLIWYCVALVAVFSYYKDGDLLMSLVATFRSSMYIGIAMAIAGVWRPGGRRSLVRPQASRVRVGHLDASLPPAGTGDMPTGAPGH